MFRNILEECGYVGVDKGTFPLTSPILQDVASFKTYDDYYRLAEKQCDGETVPNFFVDTSIIKEAVALKVLPEEVLNFKFFGFLTNDSLNLSTRKEVSFPVLHVNTNCIVKTSKLSFRSKKVSFEGTTNRVTVTVLPAKIALCSKCNFFSTLGIFTTIANDLIFAATVSSRLDVKNVKLFNVKDSTLNFFLTLERRMSELTVSSAADAVNVSKFSKSYMLSFQNEMLQVFLDIFTNFTDSVYRALYEIYKTWLSPSSKEDYFQLVTTKHSIFKTFNETPLLVALNFDSKFSPTLDITDFSHVNDEEAVELFIEDEERHVINNAFGDTYNFDCFRDDIYFNEAVIFNCLVSAFSVHVSDTLHRHLLVMPQSMYELLASSLRTVNGYSFNVSSVYETFAGDFTPESLENFVSIWNENNPDTFKIMWEASKTI